MASADPTLDTEPELLRLLSRLRLEEPLALMPTALLKVYLCRSRDSLPRLQGIVVRLLGLQELWNLQLPCRKEKENLLYL